MQQLHHLDCDWTENGHIFLHQVSHILISPIDTVIEVLQM